MNQHCSNEIIWQWTEKTYRDSVKSGKPLSVRKLYKAQKDKFKNKAYSYVTIHNMIRNNFQVIRTQTAAELETISNNLVSIADYKNSQNQSLKNDKNATPGKKSSKNQEKNDKNIPNNIPDPPEVIPPLDIDEGLLYIAEEKQYLENVMRNALRTLDARYEGKDDPIEWKSKKDKPANWQLLKVIEKLGNRLDKYNELYMIPEKIQRSIESKTPVSDPLLDIDVDKAIEEIEKYDE